MLRKWQRHKLGPSVLSLFFIIPAANAAPDWDSYYAGVSVGQRSINADWETTSYSAPDGSPLTFGTSPDASLDSSATYFEGFVGRNWLVKPNILLGLEARVGNGDNNEKHTEIPGVNTDNPPDYSYVEVASDRQLSVRGRVGYLVKPNINVYGNIGFSSLDIEASATCPADTDFCNPAEGTQSNSQSDTLNGWSAGIGVEAVLNNKWLVRGEYSYEKYGKYSFDGLPAVSGVSYGFESDIDFSGSTISVGAGYMF